MSELVLAVQNSSIGDVERLLALGTSPNQMVYNEITTLSGTLLSYSLFKGNLQIAELLLDYGAEPNIEDENRETAIYALIYYLKNNPTDEKLQMLDKLVEKGADVNHLNVNEHTPLASALEIHNYPIEPLRRLLELGCDPNIGNPIFGAIIRVGIETPLDVLDLLIEYGLNVITPRSYSGFTPLTFTFDKLLNTTNREEKQHYYDVIERLIYAGADLKAEDDRGGRVPGSYVLSLRV